jgi:thiosulfate/3-mercaptopyruvate sulfurtransferase
LEAWAKVAIDAAFTETLHGQISCTECHGGDEAATDMAAAHEGVSRDPDAATACGSCHAEVTEDHAGSLHSTLAGYTEVLAERSSEETFPQVMEAYGNHCASCHASCGQCHVSRPTSAGGGLLSGHDFRATPPQNLTCTGCHGSRIENEFKGKNEAEDGSMYPADVHYNPGGMACVECHSGEQMHGTTGESVLHRYEGEELPACVDCHSPSENVMHTDVHLERVQCQVCHVVAYKNCYSCHVQLSDESVPYFRTEPSEMAFLIGRNPIQNPERPWDYVVVRHVPIDRDSFAFYGDDLLPNFDARPTWTYATPHAVQRNTPQTASCDSCHGNEAVFLTEDKVLPDELEANREVVVTEVPGFG